HAPRTRTGRCLLESQRVRRAEVDLGAGAGKGVGALTAASLTSHSRHLAFPIKSVHASEDAGKRGGVSVRGGIRAPGEEIVAIQGGYRAFMFFREGEAGNDEAGDREGQRHYDSLHIDSSSCLRRAVQGECRVTTA